MEASSQGGVTSGRNASWHPASFASVNSMASRRAK